MHIDIVLRKQIIQRVGVNKKEDQVLGLRCSHRSGDPLTAQLRPT